MNVLVFAEVTEGAFRKAAWEAVSYGSRVAAQHNGMANVVCLSNAVAGEALQELGHYGAACVFHDASAHFAVFDPSAYAKAIVKAAEHTGAQVIVLSWTYNGRALAPLLAALLQAGLVTGAVDLPEAEGDTLKIKKNVFGGKAVATVAVSTPVKIIALTPNAIAPVRTDGLAAVEQFNSGISAADFRIRVKGVKKTSGKVVLSDAEIVVSAGRGLKGPENWPMIEELAEVLGAATACSRPVADVHWRPHEEHVGQTGLTIRPNLYIAIGISGAIQHLAGVNGSKVIVVINKDAEAPFFKAADYGIVGDAFEVVPALTRALRRFKAGELTFK